MSQKSLNQKPSSERLVKDIRQATWKHYLAEDKIRIVLDGLRGEQSHAEFSLAIPFLSSAFIGCDFTCCCTMRS
jgi:hypothetical protein